MPKPALLINMSIGCSVLVSRSAIPITSHAGQIGDDRLDVDCVSLLQFGRHVGQPIGVASHQHKIIATRRQRSRERGADA